jgi:hypothetical protein
MTRRDGEACHTVSVTTTAPPAARRRGRRRLVVGIVAIVLVYATVVTLYALSGQVNVQQTAERSTTDTDIALLPRSMNAAAAELEFIVVPDPEGSPLGDESGLAFTEPVTLILSPTITERQIEIPADQLVSPVTATFTMNGDVELWPFDTYTQDRAIIMVAHSVMEDGEEVLEPLSPYYLPGGKVPGWAIELEVQQLIDGEAVPYEILSFTARRSIAFALVLLALMIVMPVLVLMVAISAYRGRRKVEATLMSWMGAMLFATIPLRNFFPGAPPIGSWVDYLVVLWVIAGLIGGLAIFAAAWMRWTPAAEGVPR